MADGSKVSPGNAGTDVQAEFEAVRRDIAKLTEALGRYVGESAEETTSRARAHVQNSATAAQHAAEAAGTKVKDFIEERPTTSLLIAFGAGLVFGSYMRRP